MAAASWAGRRGGLLGRRPAWWRQQRSPSPRADGIARPVELVRVQLAAELEACAYVDGSGAHVDAGVLAELVRTRPKDGRCGGANANGEDKMSFSFLFIIFLKKPCMPMTGACSPVGRST
jgi:hypothetical protein